MADSDRNSADENTFIKAYEDLDKSKTPIRGPEAFPLLEIVHGPKQGAWFTVAYQKEITLGRAATNSILLEDNSVSRSHVVLQASGDGFTIRDIGSRNGTFVNDQKIQGEVPLHHLDTIKIGIYTLRYLAEPSEEPYAVKEEKTPPAGTSEPEFEGTPTEMAISPEEPEEELPPEPETVVEEPPPQETAEPEPPAEPEPEVESSAEPEVEEPAEVEKVEEVEEAEDKTVHEDQPPTVPPEVAAGAQPPKSSGSRALKSLLILLAIVLVLGAGAYAAYYFGVFDRLRTTSGPTKKPEGVGKTTSPKVIKPTKEAPVGKNLPIFLEVDATPIVGKVFYQGKELGQTPFKISVQVPAGKPQELSAEFFLEGLGEKVTLKETFKVTAKDEVVRIQLKPKLGALKVKKLPREGKLYIEGQYESAAGPTKAVQITDIVLDQPIYLPHGKYVAEVRIPEKLTGSTSTVDAVKYRREFVLGAENGEFFIEAPEESLKSFPAKITTTPPGAELLVDGKKVGETPYDGPLPTGRHKLMLKKEGFNDYEKEISIEMNTPYVANFNLETSPAGEYVNQGRRLLKKGKYNEAIEKLAEALKRNPEPTELAQIHILLGEAFLQAKTYDQALAYYQKATQSPEYEKRAQLGVAEAYAGLGKKDQALIQIINVFLNTKDAKIKSQAESAYKRIAPMKSVLYVASNPPGAQVTLNGNPIANQATPLILSDLMLGSYRLEVSKPGFKTYQSRVSLPLSAIKAVVIKLDPAE